MRSRTAMAVVLAALTAASMAGCGGQHPSGERPGTAKEDATGTVALEVEGMT